MIYQVAIDSFHGPLDLLLYLVKKDEMDVRDIPVARIAEQFLEHLQAIQLIDVEWAGDFLVMAATLVELKSKLLLPRNEESPSEPVDDPRRELVRQLIEYRKTKESAEHLDRLATERGFHVPRTAPDDEEGATSPRLRPVELWDLVSAFARLVRETEAVHPQHIVSDETPQTTYLDMVRQKLSDRRPVPFSDIFDPPYIRSRLIGYFLAILELMRRSEIVLEQSDDFGQIWITRLPPTESDS